MEILKKEKSCGAVIYRVNEFNKPEFLLLQHKNGGHWGFVKGHVENNETELETAKREILEETGLEISVFDNFFREVITYSPKKYTEKDVIYFLVNYNAGQEVKIQEEEILDFIWVGYEKALNLMIHDNSKAVLKKAITTIKKRVKYL